MMVINTCLSMHDLNVNSLNGLLPVGSKEKINTLLHCLIS